MVACLTGKGHGKKGRVNGENLIPIVLRSELPLTIFSCRILSFVGAIFSKKEKF